ncbi:MAG: terminase small subunit [Flavisolibacter sp.]
MADKRINNSFWKQRSKHGRDRKFETPEMIREAAEEYFEWCDNNPLKEEKVFGSGVHETVDVMRAYTIQGMCLFLGINMSTWKRYRDMAMYREVCEEVEMIIYEQKFTGAAGNLLNPTIIARDLGLVDKQDHTVSRGDQMDLSVLSDAELKLYYEIQMKIENGKQDAISDAVGALPAPQLRIYHESEGRPEPLPAATGAANVSGQQHD